METEAQEGRRFIRGHRAPACHQAGRTHTSEPSIMGRLFMGAGGEGRVGGEVTLWSPATAASPPPGLKPCARVQNAGPGDKEEDTVVMGLEWDQGQGSECDRGQGSECDGGQGSVWDQGQGSGQGLECGQAQANPVIRVRAQSVTRVRAQSVTRVRALSVTRVRALRV